MAADTTGLLPSSTRITCASVGRTSSGRGAFRGPRGTSSGSGESALAARPRRRATVRCRHPTDRKTDSRARAARPARSRDDPRLRMIGFVQHPALTPTLPPVRPRPRRPPRHGSRQGQRSGVDPPPAPGIALDQPLVGRRAPPPSSSPRPRSGSLSPPAAPPRRPISPRERSGRVAGPFGAKRLTRSTTSIPSPRAPPGRRARNRGSGPNHAARGQDGRIPSATTRHVPQRKAAPPPRARGHIGVLGGSPHALPPRCRPARARPGRRRQRLARAGAPGWSCPSGRCPRR